MLFFFTLLISFAVCTPLLSCGHTTNCNTIHCSAGCKRTPVKTDTVSLEQAYDLALENRSSIKAAAFDIQKQRRLQQAALAGYFPQISLNVPSLGPQSDDFPQPDAIFTISQLIWSFASPYDSYKIAQYDVKIAQYNRQLEINKAHHEAEAAHLTAWQREQEHQKIAALFFATRTTFDAASHKYQIGLISKNDWLTAASASAEQQARVQAYPSETARTRGVLEQAIETSLGDAKVIWDGTVPPELDSLDTYYKQALALRPEIKIAQAEQAKAEKLDSFYQCKYLPTVSLASNVTYYTGFKKRKFTTWSVGVAFEWTFDGLANLFQAEASQQQALQAEMESCNTVQQVKVEVQNAYHRLNELFEELQAEQTHLLQGKNAWALARKQYELGLISKVEYTQALQAWEQTKFDWKTKKEAAAQEYRNLRFACGYPIDTQVTPEPSKLQETSQAIDQILIQERL